ncbi:squalene--hopene cyclase [Stieleria sp. TO1_6]|uniref:prenyltransferase/squalene oxidase repeat-containing protein n=1 Tax=Stieleria tagensis TaxID=2956795 RepID=UPI00209B1C82|nr:prenyltransferase/squalene oxidase repeat-containing protein [Stieleria tagensis]MCO8125159.1 squalene--hopene cyclase [Stieleria tagensis]
MSLIPPTRPIEQVRQRCRQTLDQVRGELLDARHPQGHWTGRLASSALSTATAVSAMAAVLVSESRGGVTGTSGGTAAQPADPGQLRPLVRSGMQYLAGQQNADGGFGDTDRSHSNIATSYLVAAASALALAVGETPLSDDSLDRLNRYLDSAGRLEGLRERYGTDKTFVVPIMNNMAIAGLISWDDVAALPFEAAIFPQSMYRFLQMPVVSYAIPALVAIGQARHFLGRRAFWPLRQIRARCIARTLGVLDSMQPESGGYLEATPLTAFVVMSLAATDRCGLAVVQNGLRFLKSSMLPDGSWPIDTNLATWVTSLSIHALAADPDDDGRWYSDALARWHLDCQHKRRHPFTGAEPGGWGWTDLSGAVPDSDDTPAAILAIEQMKPFASRELKREMNVASQAGIGWLLKLQNRNGGWPTFCRGWGKLPFDRSSTDLTAHAIRAMVATESNAENSTAPSRAVARGRQFLRNQQNADGSWMPLWFGNQDRSDESNPVYGTAKVLMAAETLPNNSLDASAESAIEFLMGCQNSDGGWGGGVSLAEKIAPVDGVRAGKTPPEIAGIAAECPPGLVSSVEETALAVEALAACLRRNRGGGLPDPLESQTGRYDSPPGGLTQAEADPQSIHAAAGNEPLLASILRGVDFLSHAVEDRRHRIAWPIGFYFAKLWYHEALYPLIFTAAALGTFLRATDANHDDERSESLN